MRNLTSHEWDQIVYMISGLPMVIGGLALLFALFYEQLVIAIVLIGN